MGRWDHSHGRNASLKSPLSISVSEACLGRTLFNTVVKVFDPCNVVTHMLMEIAGWLKQLREISGHNGHTNRHTEEHDLNKSNAVFCASSF